MMWPAKNVPKAKKTAWNIPLYVFNEYRIYKKFNFLSEITKKYI